MFVFRQIHVNRNQKKFYQFPIGQFVARDIEEKFFLSLCYKEYRRTKVFTEEES